MPPAGEDLAAYVDLVIGQDCRPVLVQAATAPGAIGSPARGCGV